MGESYDSIGSRVIRHFRHYITGNRHIWLKGDYVDPSMSTTCQRHVEGTQTVSVETQSTSSSQGKPADQPEVPASEPLPVSPYPGKLGAEPEEQEILVEPEQTAEENMEVTDVAKVQKDSAVLNGRVKSTIEHAAVQRVETIEFAFKTSEDVETNTEEGVDETDLLMEKDDDIIDVRPFIEANRAKHAKLFKGRPEPRLPDTKIKIQNQVVENGIDESYFPNVETSKSTAHIPQVQENIGETFLSQRSVYYRSQPVEKLKKER